jgi:hypothetical protein
MATGPARSERTDPNENEGAARSKRADPNENEGPARSKRADPNKDEGRWALGRRGKIVVGLSVALFALAGIVHVQIRPRLTDVALLGPGGAHPVTFPYSAPGPADQSLVFSFVVRTTALTQRSFILVPDDHLVSISVNGQLESLAEVDPKKLDDYEGGFRFPLGRHFRAGDNHVLVRVLNRAGPGGLDVRPDPSDWRNKLAGTLAVAACLVLLGAALRRAGSAWLTIALWTVAVLIRCAYLSVTPWSLRTHDVEGHLEYIRYVLEHHGVPRAADGYSFYHPPLYFFWSAIVWRLLEGAGLSKDEVLSGLQVQSVVFNLGFSAFAVATARLWMNAGTVRSKRADPNDAPGAARSKRADPNDAPGAARSKRADPNDDATAREPRGLFGRAGLAALVAALILVWPSSVIHSVLVGNDNLTYLFMGAGLYFASRWWIRGERRDATLAALSGALGVVTKTNSLLVFVVLAVLLAARLAERRYKGQPIRPRRVLQQAWPALALAVASSALALGRSLVDTLAGRQSHVLVANAHRLTPELLVGNRAENYLWFDTRIFVTQAFTSPWDDGKGRQLFWNYLLKTGLFGEYHFADATWNLAVALSVMFLGVCAYVIAGTLRRPLSDWYRELPLFAVAGGLLASLAALRMTLPNSCTGDFRYVLPVLVPFVWWYAREVGEYRARGWIKAAAASAALGWLFAALSVAFVVVVAISESTRP